MEEQFAAYIQEENSYIVNRGQESKTSNWLHQSLPLVLIQSIINLSIDFKSVEIN